jgi:hypothetical protein
MMPLSPAMSLPTTNTNTTKPANKLSFSIDAIVGTLNHNHNHNNISDNHHDDDHSEQRQSVSPASSSSDRSSPIHNLPLSPNQFSHLPTSLLESAAAASGKNQPPHHLNLSIMRLLSHGHNVAWTPPHHGHHAGAAHLGPSFHSWLQSPRPLSPSQSKLQLISSNEQAFSVIN